MSLPTPADIKPCEWCEKHALVKPVWFEDPTSDEMDGPYYLCNKCAAWAQEARKGD